MTFHVVLHIAQLRVCLVASLALELLALTIRLLVPYHILLVALCFVDFLSSLAWGSKFSRTLNGFFLRGAHNF